jgi:hypothetical protein
VLVVALCVGAGVTTAQTQGSGTFTIKAAMLPDAAKEVARFNAGDRVLLTWSGKSTSTT